MEKSEIGGVRDPTFGSKASGAGTSSGVSKLNMGSAGTMERSEVTKTGVTFGNQASKS
jgi:hypothetical protein